MIAIIIGCGVLFIVISERGFVTDPVLWIGCGLFILSGIFLLIRAGSEGQKKIVLEGKEFDETDSIYIEINKIKSESFSSDIWLVLIIILLLVVTIKITDVFNFGNGFWYIAASLCFILIVLWAHLTTEIKSRKFNNFLESLPLGDRERAMDMFCDGALTRMKESPLYKEKQKEIEERLEKKYRRLIDKIENEGKPLTNKDIQEIEKNIEKVEKELEQEVQKRGGGD